MTWINNCCKARSNHVPLVKSVMVIDSEYCPRAISKSISSHRISPKNIENSQQLALDSYIETALVGRGNDY